MISRYDPSTYLMCLCVYICVYIYIYNTKNITQELALAGDGKGLVRNGVHP